MRLRPLACLTPFLLLGCGSSDDTPSLTSRPRYDGPPVVTIGSAEATVTLHLDTFGMAIADASGRVLLQSIAAGTAVAGDDVHAYTAMGATHHSVIIKPAVVEGWDHQEGQDQPWLGATAVASADLTSTSASLDLFDPAHEQTTVHVDIAVDGADVRVDAKVLPDPSAPVPVAEEGDDALPGLNQMGQAFILPADEHFFGLGERMVTVDHRGRHFECWTEEGGLGQGESAPAGPSNPSPNGPGMTHAPIPFLLSTSGYGLWMDTTWRTGFSLGADASSAWRLYAEEPALHYHVLVHDNPLETLEHYTSLTGRAKLPAAWVFGPRRRVDHGTLVDGIPEYQALRDRGVPTTMVDDTTHFLPGASQAGREDELRKWTADMHALGYKAIGYFNSYVSVSKEAAAPLVEEARAKGYFVKLDDGSEFNTFMMSGGAQNVATIDVTNPDAVAWYQSLLQQALDLGYDGWMLDFGEYLPAKAVMFDGRTGWEAHNAYPVDYQRAVFDYMRSARGDDFMFFARAGYSGSQAVIPVMWSGDPSASFDDTKGLPANVRAGINAGISGIPYWGSDISGYTCLKDPPADKEVYLRWAEFGALSPDMHDENACSQAPEGAPPKWTLWSDTETTDVYGRYARLHTRLIPYLYAAAAQSAASGIPIMRHPILVHPQEPDALAVEFDYYFGPDLYVAPVVRRGATSRDVWLPPGRWVDWWSLATYDGGQHITRDAPLDVLPMFLRSGGIVAMLDSSIETLAPESNPGVIGPADVAGVLDVRAAIGAGEPQAQAELADGTSLSLSLASGAVELPAAVTAASTEDELATCSSCAMIETLPDGARRVRLTTSSEAQLSLTAGALALSHTAPQATRIRWDVVVLE